MEESIVQLLRGTLSSSIYPTLDYWCTHTHTMYKDTPYSFAGEQGWLWLSPKLCGGQYV